jgi:quercetin dioxygenase-like cupin family protein
MKTTSYIAAALITASALGVFEAQAQQPPTIGRTELTHRDFGDALHEVIQTRVDFGAAAAFPRHSHPGVEIAYVLAGTLQYQFDGESPVTLKAGDSLFIPAGTIHSAKNVGTGSASELATYVVEKGKTLVVTAP